MEIALRHETAEAIRVRPAEADIRNATIAEDRGPIARAASRPPDERLLRDPGL